MAGQIGARREGACQQAQSDRLERTATWSWMVWNASRRRPNAARQLTTNTPAGIRERKPVASMTTSCRLRRVAASLRGWPTPRAQVWTPSRIRELVLTAAAQGFRHLAGASSTVDRLSNLFRYAADTPRGVEERKRFACRIPLFSHG
jgi:hypothetical protein